MPWCPVCSYEYLEDLKTCPDCNNKLKKAPGLTEAISLDGLEWIIVRKVNERHNADLIKGFLESNGIAVSLRDKVGALRNLLGEMTFAKGMIDILVPVHQASRAAGLIRDDQGWDEDELAAYMTERGDLEDDEIADNGKL